MSHFPTRLVVSMHTNGGSGPWGVCDLSSVDTETETIEAWARAGVKAGVAVRIPTVISRPMTAYKIIVPRILSVMKTAFGQQHMPALHYEGPSINRKIICAHRAADMQPPTIELFRELIDLAEGRVAYVTLCPGLPGALEVIEFLVEQGIAVSLGHSMATTQHIRDAVSAGASMVTHYPNAWPKEVFRTTTRFAALLSEPRLLKMIITDGIHVNDDAIQELTEVHPADQIAIVSDASPLAGAEPGDYTIFNSLPGDLRAGGHLPCSVKEDSEDRWLDPLSGSYLDVLGCITYWADLVKPGMREVCMAAGGNALRALAEPLMRLGWSIDKFDWTNMRRVTVAEGGEVTFQQ